MIPDRPHCQQPHACQAKGWGTHCVTCTSKKLMADLRADPEKAAKRVALSRTARDTPEFRAAASERMKRICRRPGMKAILRENGRETLAKLALDPEIQARRAAAAHASKERGLAKRYDVPLELLADLRRLRARKFPLNEARGILARSHPEAFAAMAARQAGPVPVPGDERRPVWLRRVSELTERRVDAGQAGEGGR